MITRNTKTDVRLNQREHKCLCRRAKKSGLSMAAYIRVLIMGLDVKPLPSDELCRLLQQVKSSGNNINRIARIANTVGSIDNESINEIIEMQKQILLGVKAMY